MPNGTPQAAWSRMMSGFTKPYREAGVRAGSGAAQINLARRQQQARQVGGLTAGFGQVSERARQANIARQQRIEEMYGLMEQRVQPGGAFERRGLAEIETARTRGVGREMQQMISSGMYGTTTAAGIGRGWEAEVGAPARGRLEDVMQQRLTGIQMQKAGFLERIEEPYPDYRMLMQAIMR